MKEKKIVAILGAGLSGLVSAKYMLQEGLKPLILEKHPEIGGIWNPNTGSVWSSMTTNLSKYTCSFSDFPWSDETKIFPSSQDMFEYFNNYSIHFGITPYIHFNSKVIDLKYDIQNNNWKISWESEGSIKQQNVSYVVIATGIFAESNIPDIQGIDNFNGTIIHSKNYKCGENFKDQKVLVVGGSLSAVEIASDVSAYAKVTHNFREQFWVIERYITMLPLKDKLPLDLVFYNRKFYETPVVTTKEQFRQKNTYMEKLCQNQQTIPALKVDANNFNSPIKITISDGYISQVQNGNILPKKAEIIKLDGNSVVFSDGSIEHYDSIIMATGFKTNLEYLDLSIQKKLLYEQDDQLQSVVLYKETIHPEIPGMFFIGMYKGPYFAVIEYQAKWASKIFSEKLTLPRIEEMISGLQEEYDIRHIIPKTQFPHPDYVKFADSIAKLSGEEINIETLKNKDFDLYQKFLLMSVFPGHFSTENITEQILAVQEVFDRYKLIGDIQT